jgi:hypothetical protein
VGDMMNVYSGTSVLAMRAQKLGICRGSVS